MANISNYTKAIKSQDGSINWISVLMLLIALTVLVLILYFVITNIRNQYNNTVAGEPWLVETTKSASSQLIVSGQSIPRANDRQYGIEFSYSVWIYIDGWSDESRLRDKDDKNIHHILHKGDKLADPSQCPGFWLKRDNNDLKLITKINTFNRGCGVDEYSEDCYMERCEIGNIPLNKWFHLTMVVINKNLDIYINGFLKKRCLLRGLPKQNDGDVYINSYGGFKGFLSRVRYFNYSLPIWKIEQIMKQGPSQYYGPDLTQNIPPYLSYNWWEQKFDIPMTTPS